MSTALHPVSLLPAWQPGPGHTAEHPHTEHAPSALAGSKLAPCDSTEIFFFPFLGPSVIFETRRRMTQLLHLIPPRRVCTHAFAAQSSARSWQAKLG